MYCKSHKRGAGLDSTYSWMSCGFVVGRGTLIRLITIYCLWGHMYSVRIYGAASCNLRSTRLNCSPSSCLYPNDGCFFLHAFPLKNEADDLIPGGAVDSSSISPGIMELNLLNINGVLIFEVLVVSTCSKFSPLWYERHLWGGGWKFPKSGFLKNVEKYWLHE